MEVKKGLVALTNAPSVTSYDVDSGFTRTVFSPTAVRQSSYLMAFAVRPHNRTPHSSTFQSSPAPTEWLIDGSSFPLSLCC